MNPPNNCSPYDRPEYIGVTVASVVCAFISFTASCIVISLIVLLKKYQVLVERLILYLCIATLINGISQMIHRADYIGTDINKERFCAFAGFFEQHAGWMQLGAMACITIHLFLCAVVNVRLEKLEVVYFVLIFFAPLTFNWIPFIQLAYGRAGAWCWIRDENEDCSDFPFGKVIRFVLWYIPLYVILIVLIILYIFILYKLNRTRKHWVGRYDPTTAGVKEQTRSEVIPLIWYPLIYLLLNIFPLINRIHNIAAPNNPSLALWYLHAISYPLVGAFIAIPFLFAPEMRKALHWSDFKSQVSKNWRSANIQEYPLTKDEREGMVEERKNSSNYNSFED